MSKSILKAKAKCRSKVDVYDGWKSHGFASKKMPKSFGRDVERVDGSRISKHRFTMRYSNKPLVLTNLTNWWPATQWDRKYFKKHHSSDMFRVGEDDNGKPVRVAMKDFLRYCKKGALVEDSPLYIFDSKFGLNSTLSHMYTPSSIFEDDLFELGKLPQKRPPHKWICIGPARSGTNIHQDPLGTSAWNALLQGSKRWVMFPPETPKSLIYGCQPFNDQEGISWFYSTLQKLKSANIDIYDFVQHKGETVYVPAGWHHVVVNLDFTVAVTQNFCHPSQFEYSWLKTRNARPKFARQLITEIESIASNVDDPRAQQFQELLKIHNKLATVPAMFESSTSSSSEFSESD